MPNGIAANVYQYSGNILTLCMHQLFTKLWEAAELLQDLNNASIMTIYKNKGDKRDCNNYCGISLLSVAGKCLAEIILRCLVSSITDNILPESQCGFQLGHSTVDMIFSLRLLQEKCGEQQRSLYITFMDPTKAFDTVGRDELWKLLPKFSCSLHLTNIIHQFHEGMKGHINICGELSDQFPINNCVKQGCVLAPTLFGLYFTAVLQDATSGLNSGVFLQTRTDGGLLNLARLRGKRKVRDIIVHELQFADDCALVTNSLEDIQEITSHFASAAKDFRLNISLKKTEVLYQPTPSSCYEEPTVLINDTHLKPITKFYYLASIMSSAASLDMEVESRTKIASFAFCQPKDHVWSQNIRMVTKCKAYRAVVISALLYGCETWCPYQRHMSDWPTAVASPMLPDENHLVRQGPQHQGPVPSWNACSLNHGDVSPTVLGWTYCKNAWQKTAQRHNIWPTVQWHLQMRGTTTAIQGCSTQECQEIQHCPFNMGGPGPRLHTVEELHQERCRSCWEGAQGGIRGKAQKVPQ